MKKSFKQSLLTRLSPILIGGAMLVSLLVCSLAFAVPGYAAGIWNSLDCTSASTSAVCTSKANTTDPITGSNGIILKIANIFAIVAGVAAIIVIAVAGLNYITANGDAAKIQKAKSAIIFALIGLVVIALAQTILGFVMNNIVK